MARKASASLLQGALEHLEQRQRRRQQFGRGLNGWCEKIRIGAIGKLRFVGGANGDRLSTGLSGLSGAYLSRLESAGAE
jgi:hypothetical protein